jgi:hypothetical protein
LADLEKKLTARLDVHESVIVDVLRRVMEILEAGFQMKLAWQYFQKPPPLITPTFAQDRQEKIHYGGKMGFERPVNRMNAL